MQLHEPNLENRIAKKLAPHLSRLLIGNRRVALTRKLIAYVNYLLGKGAGMGWELESEVDAALSVVFRNDPVIFDVGANLGSWSKHFREKRNDGQIFAFEPQPFCQDSITNLHLPNTTLVATTVGDQKGHTELYTSSESDGSASVHARNDSYFEGRIYEKIQVPMITLDDFIDEHNLGFVDYIKMDIEGHEFFAANGLKRAFAAKKIGAMSFEFGSGNLNSKTCFRDFWQLLSPSFNIYRIVPSGGLMLIRTYYEDIEFFRGVTNYIAVLKKHPFTDKETDKLGRAFEG